MTSHLFFFRIDGEGEHAEPTHFRYFVPVLFVEHMVLLITCIWNAY